MMEFDDFILSTLPGTETGFLAVAALAGLAGRGPVWEPPTDKPCKECAGSRSDHPCSAAHRNGEHRADCPVCKGAGKEPRPTKLVIGVAQHPVYWLAAWWSKPAAGYTWWCKVPALMRLAALANGTDGFLTFIKRYLAGMPGALSEAHAAYKSETNIRMEDLPWCAVEFFMSLGVPRAAFGTVKNVVKGDKPKLPTETWRAVIAAEREYCHAFDYF